ncbi:MAG: type VI secretion system lipoprotein TssJ [Deferribacteres bacterium]|nr:type VI secretion system lipoprotein TssJ [Deferribacteres bacterium]
MRTNIRILFAAGLAFFFISCATTVQAPYKQDAITLHLKSSNDLNLYNGKAHTLLLCVYQLKDPNAFNQLLDERDGLPRLLECRRFDPSVTGSRRLIINPGREITRTLDRAEGTKYVGVAAGYYKMEPDSMVRLYQIPVNMFTKSLKELKIRLFLGPHEIQGLEE